MLKELFMVEIQDLIKQKNWRLLKETLSGWPAPDIAELLESLELEERVIAFRLLSPQLAADVFSEFDIDKQVGLLYQLSNEHIREIISGLDPDDRTGLFEELPGRITQRFLNLLSPEDRKDSLKLLGYPENSMGRLMTSEYVIARPGWSIEEALKHIRRCGSDAETVNVIYVVDEAWHLIDDIPLRRLILADPQQKVEEVMDRRAVSISVFEDQEEAIKIMKHYNLVALPVVDSENILLGIVTIDDIIDVLEDEVTEDFHKEAGVIPLGLSYSATSPPVFYRKRIVWLSFLVLAGFLSGSIIGLFEKVLAEVIGLAIFIPVLIGTGGNTATQSSTLIIRALATGDLTVKKWASIIKKEMFVGILLGVSLGLIFFLGGFFWKGIPMLGLAVGISAVMIVFWANLVGSFLPIILTRLKLDPAVVSTPLLSTMLDVTGLLIYFSMAKWLFEHS